MTVPIFHSLCLKFCSKLFQTVFAERSSCFLTTRFLTSDTWLVNIFSAWDLPLKSLKRIFKGANGFTFWWSPVWQFFWCMNDALSAVSINLAQTFLLSLILPHRSFIILKSIFRSVVHFEIISVCGKELNSVEKKIFHFSTEMPLTSCVCDAGLLRGPLLCPVSFHDTNTLV